jgi:hypothetical protein
MAASAQAQVEATKAAQRARIAHARANNGHASAGNQATRANNSTPCGQCWGTRRRALHELPRTPDRLDRPSTASRMTPAGAEAALAAWGLKPSAPTTRIQATAVLIQIHKVLWPRALPEQGVAYRRSTGAAGSPFRPCKLSAVRVRIYARPRITSACTSNRPRLIGQEQR